MSHEPPEDNPGRLDPVTARHRPSANGAVRIPPRALHLIVIAAVTLAGAGYLFGLGQPVRPEGVAHPFESAGPAGAGGGDAVPAVTYADMAARRMGPNQGWRSELASLVQRQVTYTDDEKRDPTLRAASLAERAARRAYNGAPPTVPHTVDQISAAACMACHQEGTRVDARLASPMPHPFLANCTQCHVEDRTSAPVSPVIVESLFLGLPAPFQGERAWSGAPPTVPHSTWMRDDCLSCHGPMGRPGMMTTHPERQNCLQCHAPSATLDQRPASDPVQFLRDLSEREW